MLTPIDIVVIAAYLVGVVAFGLLAGGRQRSSDDYFLGGRDLPWWAVCGSVVATETSTLTVIGIPAVAYGGSFVFLQLAAGYIVGRVVVARVLLPRYWSGGLRTAYALLGQRFGGGVRALASVTFLGTRLLADGVRLFATAIPIRVVLLSGGIDASYPVIIAGVAAATVAYTLVGGLRAVVWMDVVQLGVYVLGAALALVLLAPDLADGGLAAAAAAGKLTVIDPGLATPLAEWLASPYVLPVALVGGALFAMASHGADQLIVQRVLACRSLPDAQRAMVWSGVAVAVQFALFLAVGVGLWAFYDGASVAALGLSRGDEIFPAFILDEMPVGVRGLVLAGIVAAAMSTLSSSLNALAGSTLFDLVERLGARAPEGEAALRWSRALTLVWGVVFVGFAVQFESTTSPVVELGLGVAGFTYGALLGAFALALFVPRAGSVEAAVSFVAAVAAMTLVIGGVWWSGAADGWTWAWRPAAEARELAELRAVAWPLYPAIGTLVSLAVGATLGAVRGRGEAAPEPQP